MRKTDSKQKLWKVRVLDCQEVGSAYLIFSVERPKGFDYKAGQHVTFQFPTQPPFESTYSIASAPSRADALEFCIQTQKDEKSAQAFLKVLQAPTPLVMSAAAGTFNVRDPSKPLIFVAGGSGISPLRAFATDLMSPLRPPTQVTLLYGCKDSKSIPFKNELKSLQDHSVHKFYLHLAAEEGPSHAHIFRGNVLELLEKKLPEISSGAHFYLCGPPALIQGIRLVLSAAQVQKEAIFTEGY